MAAIITCRPEEVAYIDIFPPVGIARIGNSPDEYFIGPEVPDQKVTPDGGFKDANGLIKRQAARFRVYAFDKNNNVLGEVTANYGYTLTWSASVANTKAAGPVLKQRTEDPVNQLPDNWPLRNKGVTNRDQLAVRATASVSGTNSKSPALQGTFQSTGAQVPVYLGELRTDEAGRLLFLGGRGLSQFAGKDPSNPRLTSFDNNDDWVDDVCDGLINVQINHKDLRTPISSKNGAWVVTAAPKFGWAIRSPISQYDLLENIYQNGVPGSEGVNFFRDIWPIFYSTSALSWVDSTVQEGHAPGSDYYDFLAHKDQLSSTSTSKNVRNQVFKYIRPDITAPNDVRVKYAQSKYMPQLSGDSFLRPPPNTMVPGKPDTWLSLTTLQYKRLQKWLDGDFVTGSENYWPPNFDTIPHEEQPAALTLAALQWTIGGAFFPGIEVWWRSSLPDWYLIGPNNNGYPAGVPPFRVDSTKIVPGEMTKQMAEPWQADFQDCDDGWWPAARPLQTIPQTPNPSVDSPRAEWNRGITDGVPLRGDPNEDGRLGMVRNFWRLAFIVPLPGTEVRMEEERDPSLQPSN